MAEKKKKTDESKETSKWVLGGDGITNIVIPKENLERIKKMKLEAKPKTKKK